MNERFLLAAASSAIALWLPELQGRLSRGPGYLALGLLQLKAQGLSLRLHSSALFALLRLWRQRDLRRLGKRSRSRLLRRVAACCERSPPAICPCLKGPCRKPWCRSSHVTDPDRPPQHLRLASRGESIPSEHLLAFGPFALSSLLWSKQRTSAAAFGPCVLSSRLPLRKRRLR